MSWLSKKLKKSKSKGTGVFSWGKSKLAQGALKSLDAVIPGAGTILAGGAKRFLNKGKGSKSSESSKSSSIVRITDV